MLRLRRLCVTNVKETGLFLSLSFSPYMSVSNKCLHGVTRDNDTTVSVVPPVSGGPRNYRGGPGRNGSRRFSCILCVALFYLSFSLSLFLSAFRAPLIKFETQGPPVERHGRQCRPVVTFDTHTAIFHPVRLKCLFYSNLQA